VSVMLTSSRSVIKHKAVSHQTVERRRICEPAAMIAKVLLHRLAVYDSTELLRALLTLKTLARAVVPELACSALCASYCWC
jgi:hypothetical protein